MRDPANPIADDIRHWAFDATAEEPIQDWDLILSTVAQTDLFLELAATNECPKADYFLAVLYLIVGDAVRTGYNTHSKGEINGLLKKAESSHSHRSIHLWTQRSRHLIAHPETFQYDDWCAGVLARQQEDT
jgi:hypothetical protein